MKQHLSYALKLFGNRMFFNVVTVCMVPVFIPIIDNWGIAGRLIFSATICSVYLAIVFDMIWKLGKHDRKPYATEKHYSLKGLAIGLLSEVPFLVLFGILLLAGGAPGMRAVYRCLAIAPYMSLVPEDAVTMGYALVLLIAPVFSGIAYPVGYRKPNYEKQERIRKKIFYKTKEE